jgi:phage tail sheath protein FI
MPLPLSYPGVYVEEVPSGVRTIAGVATSIGLFIGWARRGSTEKAVRIFSFADFAREYGELDTDSLLGYAVRHFFDNGGSDAYVIRIAKLPGEGVTDAAVPATASNGDLEITATSPGEWAHEYAVRITHRTDGTGADAALINDRFKLEVTLGAEDDSPVVESFENLSNDPDDPRFVDTAVSGRSRIITVEAGAAMPTDDTVELGDGDEGSDGAVLTPAGATAGDFETALEALFADGGIADTLDLFNIVCVPGETNATTIQTLVAKVARKRAFLVVDSPEEATFEEMSSAVAGYIGGDASYSAIYYPWVRAPDPRKQGAVRAFPPCGYVAGIMARTDSRRGVWKAPAGTDAALVGIVGFDETINDSRNGVLNLKAVNCLRTLPVYGNVVWGSRTLEGDNNRGSEWKYVPVRRMALFLEESLYRGTQWVVFEPNDEPLWSQIRLNIGAFMQTLFRQGAFQGATPREAYFVKCDRTTTTQTDINMGIVNIHVGFAPLKPAEFVVIRIQQIAGDIPT